uniref:Deoxyhypusine synthase n=1 Tax=Cairina moschata TaxID=8855 RepID=A0A8C3BN07_CAIMO
MAAPCCTAPLGAGPGGGGGGEGAAGPMAAAAAAGGGPAPAEALRAVLKPSGALPAGSLPVRGYDFAAGPDHAALLRSFLTTGFQATSFGQAVAEIRRMIAAKLEPLSAEERGRAELSGCPRPPSGCTIFLGFTSNLISSGVRETIRYLVQRGMVDVLVTTAGGVEEDLIKCLAPTYIGDFSLRGRDLRQNGINRIGNLLVPNDNYCKFEDWLMPILDQMVDEQETQNKIPVLSPALTDGSLGDMIFFHSYKRPGLVLDIVEDLRLINTQAIFARKTGMIILGGGLVKHHIANANLMRNGADFSVYVNTAQEFDGSDSGARPDEAVSWGKIRMDATPVKVQGGPRGSGGGFGEPPGVPTSHPCSPTRSTPTPRWFFRCWWRRRSPREPTPSPWSHRATEPFLGGLGGAAPHPGGLSPHPGGCPGPSPCGAERPVSCRHRGGGARSHRVGPQSAAQGRAGQGAGRRAAPVLPVKTLHVPHAAGLFLLPGGGGGCPSGIRIALPLGLEAVLAPELDAALGGGEQAGQRGVEGERLHHAAAHRQRQRQRALRGGGLRAKLGGCLAPGGLPRSSGGGGARPRRSPPPGPRSRRCRPPRRCPRACPARSARSPAGTPCCGGRCTFGEGGGGVRGGSQNPPVPPPCPPQAPTRPAAPPCPCPAGAGWSRGWRPARTARPC